MGGGGGGGNCFCGERKFEEYPKIERNLLLFGEEFPPLASYPGHVVGGKSALFSPNTWPGYEAISPPKGPEKNTARKFSAIR